jgi:hypothetical protein
MIYLKKYYAILSVIYNIVYFAVPGEVEDLSLEPGSHNISVNWSKPTLNSYCVTQYVIYWSHTINGINDSSIVPSEEDFIHPVLIENLDACVEYEVSVRAENEENESKGAVTNNTTTETDGNCHEQIILLCL